MTVTWVLDAEAVAALADAKHKSARAVAKIVVTASRLGHGVCVPTVVLADCQRGRARTRQIDALLSRDPALRARDTDRALARYVGAVLHSARAGSEDIADAHCVATAVEAGGGVVVTTDVHDLNRLSASFPHVVVEGLGG